MVYDIVNAISESVAKPCSPRDSDSGVEIRQAIRQVHQHVDERHDIPAGREPRVAIPHTRDPGSHGEPGNVGSADG